MEDILLQGESGNFFNDDIEDKALTVSGKETKQYLTFSSGSDMFGLSTDHILEVIGYENICPVPRSPACIRGIINLRGEIIPVVDLNLRLSNKSSPVTRLTNIIIIELDSDTERARVGVINDSVKEVIEISEDDIEKTPGFGINIRKDFISGVGKVRDDFVILLNIAEVVNANDISLSETGLSTEQTQ